MDNNKQDLKFKDLSTKKKVIHYIGWPLLTLGCVGTIVFGVLWSNNKNPGINTIDIEYTSDEWVDSPNDNFDKVFGYGLAGVTSDTKYRVSFSPSKIPEEHDVAELFNIYLFIYHDDFNPVEGISAPVLNWDFNVYIDSVQIKSICISFENVPQLVKDTNALFAIAAHQMITGKSLNITEDSKITFEFSFMESEDIASHIYTAVMFDAS